MAVPAAPRTRIELSQTTPKTTSKNPFRSSHSRTKSGPKIDVDAIRRVGEMARDYLLLGLEHLTGGQPSRAVEVVRDTEMQRIFQVGFSLTLALKYRADRLMKTPLAEVEGAPLLFDASHEGVDDETRPGVIRLEASRSNSPAV